LAVTTASAIYNGSNDALSASGSIETTVVSVSPEMAGKVGEVLVEEGETVKAGDPLLRLDDSLLVAQQAVAAAQVESAKAGAEAAQNALNTINTEQYTQC
jgi:multidrug efflux pump subunit AcrA (membrane-fusion protein)